MKQVSIAIAMALGMLSGCSSDGRLANLAEQVVHEQAAQNQRAVESSQAIAQGSQQLVTADAQARTDLIDLQHALRHDQAEIAEQLTELEAERREVAQDRLLDSAMGNGLVTLGLVCAALAPLLLAAISLLGLWREPTREEEGHILVDELSKGLLEDRDPSVAKSHPGLRHLGDSTDPRT
jgi:hypothetical protein